MQDDHFAGFCTMCGMANPGNHRFCPGCGASLVETTDSPAPAPATAPVPDTSGTANGENSRQVLLLLAGGTAIVLIIAVFFMTGYYAALFPSMVAGTYRESGDTLGLALSEIRVDSTGAFSEGLLAKGTWTVEGNRLRVVYMETRLVQESCTGATILALCPVKAVQVPSGTVKYWDIGWNTLVQDGKVWHKGEPGLLGAWRNY